MSLLLSGAKTITFAGTEMQCLEIYTGEAYTINLNFTDSGGSPVDIAGWTFTTTAAYYSVDTVTYAEIGAVEDVQLGNITLDPGSPTQPPALVTATISAPAGTAYLYVPAALTDGLNGRPSVPLVDGKANPSVLAIITIEIDRTDPVSALPNISREPLGFIVRYQ